MAVDVMRMKFGASQWGWTEVCYLAGDPDTNQAIAASKPIAVARRAFLADDVDLESITLESTQDENFRGLTRYGETAGCGEGLATGSASQPWLAMLLRLYTPQFNFRRMWWMRGIPDAWTKWGGIDFTVVTLPSAMITALNVFRSATGTKPVASSIGSADKIAILGREWPLGTGTEPVRYKVEKVNKWGTCNQFVFLATNAVLPDVGTKVHLHGFTGCWAKGANGDAVVVAINPEDSLPTPPAGSSWVLTDKQLCCADADMVYNGRGSYYQWDKRLRSAAWCNIVGIRVRDTGKPAMRMKGRRRGRGCCR